MMLHEVSSGRVFPVPDSTVEKAISLLKKQPAVALSESEATHLLSQRELDPDSMLRDAAAAATREAEKWEGEAARWSGKDSEYAARSLEEARTNHRVAEHALSLLGRLKPYLVRGLVLNEGSEGNFELYFAGTELLVNHPIRQMDLSLNRFPMKRRPVIVFLEGAQREVKVTINVD